MTFKFKDVYINDVATVTGPYEKAGPLGKYFDMCYDDLYLHQKNWEEAEIKLIKDSIDLLVKKSSVGVDMVDLFIGGDLLNQIVCLLFALFLLIQILLVHMINILVDHKFSVYIFLVFLFLFQMHPIYLQL